MRGHIEDLLIQDSGKIRKRGCSSSSVTSSKLHNYKLKRPILLGKRDRGFGSRSSTPVPTWRITASLLAGGAVESPKYESGRSRPVSARKLAATLWEMNEMMPLERMVEEGKKVRRRQKMTSLPPHSAASDVGI